jgi:poly-gamma-glutamate capsule biosynthesis protein CapA/YwtB (metallophosphatase superfamily)
MEARTSDGARGNGTITLFLCGDVMTGRGVDQILPHPVTPQLHEPLVDSALTYVELAEEASGPIPRPVDFGYVWGDAPAELERARVDARIVNLETAVTTSSEPWPRKHVLYRMHPANVPCLKAAGIDCCVLANNHVLDWGREGLAETLDVLHRAGLRTAGAGRDEQEARAPAIVDVRGAGRVLVFGFGSISSGIPPFWAAARDRSGVHLLDDHFSERAVDAISAHVREVKRERDVVVASIHWGSNWGYEIPAKHRAFAQRLIEEASVDVVHGHSSHHVKGIEVHRERPILYGCGDFLTDYEGIRGYEEFRGGLGVMYLPELETRTGRLVSFRLVPTRVRRFRVERAPSEDASWLLDVLNREGRELGGTRVELQGDGTFALRWNP